MKNKEMKIAPSVLAGDFVNMEESIRLIESASCEWIHLDIMDGSFVPPITFGAQMVGAIRKTTRLFLDVHMMIDSPENQIEYFASAGADAITIHFENTIHTHRILQDIRNSGMKAGIAIVPSTPVAFLSEILPIVDIVLVMTVNPGFGGQKLIPACVNKIKQLQDIRITEGYDYLISADGGINRETAAMVRDAGLDIAVAGSSFFGADDPSKEAGVLQGRK